MLLDPTPPAGCYEELSIRLDGWARFSKDDVFRYRLGRVFDPNLQIAINGNRMMAMPRLDGLAGADGALRELDRVVFVLCNPSDATAFKPDPTVSRCCEFARRWGANALEVVNLYALRSPYPTDLDAAMKAARPIGTGPEANTQILAACLGATRVIAGWGNNGWREERGVAVRELLRSEGIPLFHLGLTKDGYPLHPLARGKHFIPYDREPVEWH